MTRLRKTSWELQNNTYAEIASNISDHMIRFSRDQCILYYSYSRDYTTIEGPVTELNCIFKKYAFFGNCRRKGFIINDVDGIGWK